MGIKVDGSFPVVLRMVVLSGADGVLGVAERRGDGKWRRACREMPRSRACAECEEGVSGDVGAF